MSGPCEFESLESRKLLSLTIPHVEWSLTSRGTLVISGSGLTSDAIHVTRAKGDKIRFVARTEGGMEVGSRFSASRVKRVLVDAGYGNDRVAIDPTLGKRVTVLAGAGNDHVHANPGATVIGGGGNDRLQIHPPVQVFAFMPVGETPRIEVFDEPGLLSGGAGNDTLVAGANDTVVGGVGDDRAVLHLVDLSVSADRITDKPQFARDAWDERATGIETFDVLDQRPIDEIGVPGITPVVPAR